MPRVLKVLPDRDRVEEALLAGLGDQDLVLGGDLATVSELAALLEGPAEPGRTFLAPPRVRALLGGCAARLDLGPFDPVRDRPSFVRAAQHTLASLKLGRCWHETFADAARRFPQDRAGRVQALARLYSSYEEALAGLSAFDAQDALAAAVRHLRAPGSLVPAPLADVEEVVFEDVYDWVPLRLELVLALADLFEREGKGRRVRVLLPHDPERPDLMAFVDPVYEQLYARAQRSHSLEIVPKAYGDGDSPPVRLSRALFRTPAASWSGAPAAAVVSLAGPEEEAREIARRIRDLVEQGADPGGIAVALRHPSQDAERIAEALERYGVRVRVRRGSPLSRSGVARLALLLSTAARDHLPLSTFEALASAGLPGAFVGEGGRALKALHEAGVRSDRDASGPGAFRRALSAVERRRARTGGDVDGARLAGRLAQSLLDAASRVPAGRTTLGAFSTGVAAALRELGALDPSRRWTVPTDFDAGLWALAREQAAARRVADLLGGLAQAFAAVGRGEEALEPAQFAAVLADALADATLPPRGPRGGAVRVTDVRELVGRSFDHVLLAGLVEGRFPAAPEPDPLFPDEDRARLNALVGFLVVRGPRGAGGPLPERLAEEPLLFHLALASAQRSVTLTWPRCGEDDRETVASRFVEEVLRVGGAAVHQRRARATIPAARDARSLGELVARAALEHLGDPVLRAFDPDPTLDPPAVWAELARDAPSRLASVERRVDCERERFRFFSREGARPGRFTGALGSTAAEALAPRLAFGPDRPLSPRQLGDWGNCRFRGFATHLLGLRPEEPVEVDASAATKGDLCHRALCLFFDDRRLAGRLPVEGSADDLAALDRALAEAAEAVARERPVGHPALWELAVEAARRTLERVVRAEARAPVFPGLLPARFEVALGAAGLPLLAIAGPGDEAPVAVGGRIDRIDEGTGRAAAVDYKSSRYESLARRFRDELFRKEFQLPVYAAALAAPGRQVDAAFLSLRDARAVVLSEVAQPLGVSMEDLLSLDPEVRRDLKRRRPDAPNLGDAVWAIVRDARAGLCPVRPLDCSFCGLEPVCRVSAQIVAEELE